MCQSQIILSAGCTKWRLVAYAHLIHIDSQRPTKGGDWRDFFFFSWMGKCLFISSPEVYQLQKLFSLIQYLIFALFYQGAANILSLHEITGRKRSNCAVTCFYNRWDMLISRCFIGAMTLLLVKSTLVSRCVYTCERGCFISAITVSNA